MDFKSSSGSRIRKFLRVDVRERAKRSNAKQSETKLRSPETQHRSTGVALW
jgi:hypothetical protein